MSGDTFLELAKERHLGATGQFFDLIWFPCIPWVYFDHIKEHRKVYFEPAPKENVDLENTFRSAQNIIEGQNRPDGYPIGMNCGRTAGKTLFHSPGQPVSPYQNDMIDPKGGPRHGIPRKGKY